MTGGHICHRAERIAGAVYIGPPPTNLLPIDALGNLDDRVLGAIFGRAFAWHLPPREALEEYAHRLSTDPDLLRAMRRLRERPLACTCRHSSNTSPLCHGDLILAALERWTDGELLRRSADLAYGDWTLEKGHGRITFKADGGAERALLRAVGLR